MRKIIFLLCLSFPLLALNRLQFNDIMLGTPITQIIERYGAPYAVYDSGNGAVQYEYIERISMNNQLVYENHYYLTVVNNKIVKKCFREENRPPYDQMYEVDPNFPTYP